MNAVAQTISTTVANAPWPFLLDVFIKSAVVLVGAFAASLLMRRASASVRHHIWSMALASILLLPLLAAAMPAWQLPLLPRIPVVEELLAGLTREPGPIPEAVPDRGTELGAPGASEPQLEPRPQVEAAPLSRPRPQVEPEPRPEPKARVLSDLEPVERSERELTSNVAGVTSGTEGGGPGNSTPSLGFWLFALWFSVATVLLGRLLVGAVVATWIARSAEKVEDRSWTRLTRRLVRQLGISTDVALVRNERTGMPMAWGLFRPVVLLPADSKTWSAERRRVVLLHELAHVKRHDCQTQILAQIACAAHWFNPLVWQAARRLRAEREQACDDLVLASGTKGTDYAQHLLEIARSMRVVDHAAWAAVSMAKPSQMEGRLMAILDSDRDRRSLTRIASISAVLLVAALVLPLAALQPWAEAEEATAAPVEQVLTEQKQAELQRQIEAQLEMQLQLHFGEQLEFQLQELIQEQLEFQLQELIQEQLEFQLQEQFQARLEFQLQELIQEQLEFQLQEQHLGGLDIEVAQQLQQQLSHQLQGLELNEAALEGSPGDDRRPR